MNIAYWKTQTKAERFEAMMTDLLDLIPDHRRQHLESMAIEARACASNPSENDIEARSAAEDDQTRPSGDRIDLR